MKTLVKISAFVLGLIVVFSTSSFAQDIASAEAENPEYIKVLKGRSEKIVNTLEIDEPEKQTAVRDLIVMQYYNLSKIQDARDALIEAAENQPNTKEKKAEKKIEKIKKKADKKVKKLHKEYLAQLSEVLNANQIDKVKNGMTYNVVPITYKGYLALLPDLTPEQKEKIMQYLVDAREIAMDAGSSEKKHYWFGQYKGKINNYLSSQGYDLKEAEEQRKARRNEH